jgi:hypothetical protein
MVMKNLGKALILSCLLAISTSALACDGAGKSTHMGSLMSVDAGSKSFTIMDAQTQVAITFAANDIIMDGLKDAKGNIMVNYTGEGEQLTAVGVTF